MSIVRTFCDYIIGADNAVWVNIKEYTQTSATYIIGLAVSCIGISTDVIKTCQARIQTAVSRFYLSNFSWGRKLFIGNSVLQISNILRINVESSRH
jgi:hypothetical protein